MKNSKRYICLILMSVLLILPLGTLANGTVDHFEYVKDYILSNYKFDVTNEQLMEGAVKKVLAENPEIMDLVIAGMFEQLDDYSSYYDRETYKELVAHLDGQEGGVGILPEKLGDYISVISTIDNMPAQRADIRSGDIIVAVDGTDIKGMDIDLVIKKIRGLIGEPVTLQILRDGQYLDVTLIRELLIEYFPLSYKVIGGDIGYIQTYQFIQTASEYFDKALAEFDEKGITKLIIDLRNNPGGRLDQVLEVCSKFVPKDGVLLWEEFKNSERDMMYYSKSESTECKYDIVVLINQNSASASEIMAAALADNDIATVVGVQSFGKGTVQNVMSFYSGEAIKLTIAKFLTPDKKEINSVGVTPDIIVENPKYTVRQYYNMEQFPFENQPTLGDTCAEVLIAKKRLKLLRNWIDNMDETMDEQTFELIKDFQQAVGMEPTGVLDFKTQLELDSVVNGMEAEDDIQMEKAVEILKNR